MKTYELEQHLLNHFNGLKKTSGDNIQVHDLDFSAVYEKHPDLNPARVRVLAMDAGLSVVPSVEVARTLPQGQSATYLVLSEDIKESLQSIGVNALIERSGTGLAEVYPELDEKIWEVTSDAFEKVSRAYELFGGTTNESGKIEEIEHVSRDGFASRNDGGYQGTGFTDISMLVGSGRQGNLPDKAEKAVEDSYNQGLGYALDAFKEEYADEIKDIPEDKLNYHDLYELGKGSLAEKLSELEYSQNSDEQSTVMFQIRTMFHNEGPENLLFTIQGAVNWEAPYHRPKGQWEDYFQSEVEFTETEMKSNMNEVVEKVKAELKKAVEHLGA